MQRTVRKDRKYSIKKIKNRIILIKNRIKIKINSSLDNLPEKVLNIYLIYGGRIAFGIIVLIVDSVLAYKNGYSILTLIGQDGSVHECMEGGMQVKKRISLDSGTTEASSSSSSSYLKEKKDDLTESSSSELRNVKKEKNISEGSSRTIDQQFESNLKKFREEELGNNELKENPIRWENIRERLEALEVDNLSESMSKKEEGTKNGYAESMQERKKEGEARRAELESAREAVCSEIKKTLGIVESGEHKSSEQIVEKGIEEVKKLDVEIKKMTKKEEEIIEEVKKEEKTSLIAGYWEGVNDLSLKQILVGGMIGLAVCLTLGIGSFLLMSKFIDLGGSLLQTKMALGPSTAMANQEMAHRSIEFLEKMAGRKLQTKMAGSVAKKGAESGAEELGHKTVKFLGSVGGAIIDTGAVKYVTTVLSDLGKGAKEKMKEKAFEAKEKMKEKAWEEGTRVVKENAGTIGGLGVTILAIFQPRRVIKLVKFLLFIRGRG
jgi:hypothetical protein